MNTGKVEDLFHCNEMVIPNHPMRQSIRINILIYPRGGKPYPSLTVLTGQRGTLVVTKRQHHHLVLNCADNRRRSFGSGTRIVYQLPITAA